MRGVSLPALAPPPLRGGNGLVPPLWAPGLPEVPPGYPPCGIPNSLSIILSVHFDWSQVNTLLLVGAIGYLWKQSRVVDRVKQALVGIEGQEDGGALGEIKLLRARSHDLSNALGKLTGSVELLTHEMQELKGRFS